MTMLKQNIVIFLAILMTACGGSSPAADPVADTTAPYVSNANPTESSVVSALTSIEFTFSEEVIGADVLANYALSGTGSGTLILGSVSYVNRVATLSIAGLVNNGAVAISLNNVIDLADNALPAYTLTLSGSTISPTQTASPVSGTDNHTALNTVEITYSKEMDNTVTDPVNYILSGTAVGTLSLDTVALKSGTTSTYILTFSGTPTDGSLDIDISGITDLLGNALAGTNINYTFDVTAPLISTTIPANGTLQNTASASITVKYSEAVNGKDLTANYALSGTAVGGATPLAISSITPGTTTQSTIYLSGVALEGSLTLTISNITDPAGNALAGNNTITVTIDPVAPIRTWDPVDLTVLSSLSTVTVTYSEPVLNADNIASYNLTGNSKGTLAIASIANTPPGSDIYVLTMSGNLLENNIYKDISLVSGSPMVTDLAGNNVTSQVHWTVDQSAPTLNSVTPAASNLAILSLTKVRLEYSEAMSADVLNASKYVLSGVGVGSLAVGVPVLVSGNVYDIPLTGTPGVGDVTLSIGASDAAGNAAAENITYTFGTPVTTTIRDTTITKDIRSLASNGVEIIAIGDSNWFLHSTDGGATWGKVAGDQSSGDEFYCRGGSLGLQEMIYAEGKWTAVGGIADPYNGTGIHTSACNSSDGSIWSNKPATDAAYADAQFSGIVHNGTDYVAIGRNPASTGATTQCLHSISSDGITWPVTPSYCKTLGSPLTVNTQPNGIHFANGIYFITGSNALLGPVVSRKADITDTVTNWIPISSTFQRVDKIIHDGTRYLVAGTINNHASIAYSVDLVNWTYVTTSGFNNMTDIGYDSTGGYIAIGSGGIMLTSTDGVNWTKQVSGTTNPLYSLLWDATAANWVVVGFGGVALTVAP